MSTPINCTLYRLVKDPHNRADKVSGTLYCNDSDDLNECVFMTSRMFKIIWGNTWSSMNQEDRILPVVKISYKGQSIYRRYRQISATGFTNNHIGLTQKSIGLLCSNEPIINKQGAIQVSVGTDEDFFENHPDHLTRKAYQMGVESSNIGREANRISKSSMIVSFASLFLSIISIIIAFILNSFQS